MKNYFKKHWLIVYILATTLIFLARIVNFAAVYGGVEHDSGWYLGVARNLAERGIYASYTNTIVREGTGAYPSIHSRFSVQDKDGFIYFPAGVSVGPGYIVLEALILKIFGNDFWQYRAWPLLSFAGLLALLFYLAFRIGGVFSLILLSIWLWFIPGMYLNFTYEAFSEQTALFYLLTSFLIFYQSTKSKGNLWLVFFPGLLLSLSILTKNLFALPGAGFLVALLLQFKQSFPNLKLFTLKWLLFLGGLILPLMGFDLYRRIYLTSRFGQEGLDVINKDIAINFQIMGSGLDLDNLNLQNLDWTFVAKKATVWAELGIKYPWLIWLFLLIFPLVLIKYIKKEYFLITGLIYSAVIFSSLWYIFISPFGWTRHVWQSLPLTMLLICITIGLVINNFFNNWQQKFYFLIFGLFFLAIVVSPDKIHARFNFNQADLDKWRVTRNERGVQGLPFAPIPSLKDQQAVIKFFSQHILPQDRIYYLQILLVAEMSSLVDKVFYPYDRYINNNYQNPDGGKSYLIFGPYQMGPESFFSTSYLPAQVQQFCQKKVFANSSYLLCQLK